MSMEVGALCHVNIVVLATEYFEGGAIINNIVCLFAHLFVAWSPVPLMMLLSIVNLLWHCDFGMSEISKKWLLPLNHYCTWVRKHWGTSDKGMKLFLREIFLFIFVKIQADTSCKASSQAVLIQKYFLILRMLRFSRHSREMLYIERKWEKMRGKRGNGEK